MLLFRVVAKLMLQGFVNTAKYAGSAPSVAYSDTAPAGAQQMLVCSCHAVEYSPGCSCETT